MKKLCEKHSLLVGSLITLFIAIILSWIFPEAYYSNGKLGLSYAEKFGLFASTANDTRVGLFDITTYGQLVIYYFTTIFVFAFVVAGFYKLLGSTAAYQKLTDNIAKKFEGKEKIFVGIAAFIIACISGVSTEQFAIFALIPFVISILSKLKVDKVSGVTATFGAVLVGILGATYSVKISGQLANTSTGLGVSYGNELLATIILFVIAYALLMFFTFVRMNKVQGTKENALIDPFMGEEVKAANKKNVKTLPLVICIIILFVSLILAYIGWEGAFGVTAFKDALAWIQDAELFNSKVYSHILGGTLAAFGSWDLFIGGGLILIASMVIKFIYRIPFSKVVEEFVSGFKAIGKPLALLVVVYTVLEISVIYPRVPGLVSLILGMGTNIATIFISSILTTVFAVDFQYVVSLIAGAFSGFSNLNAAAFALQAAYGLVGFIAPTSAILVFGLSMFDISLKEWFKHIWKFLLSLLVVIIIILIILMVI